MRGPSGSCHLRRAAACGHVACRGAASVYAPLMSTDTRAETQRLGVETTGIEIIDEAARTARPKDLFWPWFAANVSVFGISYAGFVLGFTISFWQAVLVTVIGVVVSFLLCGLIAIAGKRGSA